MKRSKLAKKAPKHTNSWYRKKMVERAKIEALERDGYVCQKCGKSKYTGWAIHGSHVFPEGRYHGMSANPLNIKALCYDCHFNWWHKNPLQAAEWFKAKFPERYKKLKQLSQKVIQVDWKKLYETKTTN